MAGELNETKALPAFARILWFSFITVTFFGSILFVNLLSKQNTGKTKFEQLQTGMTVEAVEAVLGEQNLFPPGSSGDTFRKAWIVQPATFLMDEYCVEVDFDMIENRVVHAHAYTIKRAGIRQLVTRLGLSKSW